VVRSARPEVIVHLITDLPDQVDPAGLTEMTNRNARICVEGTRAPVATSVPRLDGLVLRYGQLYGPGTWNLAPTGSVPLHVESAARAAALAAVRGGPGIYNVVDDGAAASNAKARSLGWGPALR
jgi:hypothetical protein